MEQRELARALRASLNDDDEDESDDEVDLVMRRDDDDTSSDEDEKEQSSLVIRADGWSTNMTRIDIPMPRLRAAARDEIDDDTTPYRLFSQFLTTDIIDEFVTHTNAYAPRGWTPTTRDEIRAFIGVRIYMGIVRLPMIDLYWSDEFNQSLITTYLSRARSIQTTQSLFS
jgi:hypothetical protein